MTGPRAWLAWSSGKDSAWALHTVRQTDSANVVGLLTTVTEPFERVTMHAVRDELVQAQARSLGLDLHRVTIPAQCSHDAYAAAMRRILEEAKSQDVTHIVFGDLFLSDVRAYREEQLAQVDMTACFPLWERDTASLARQMIRGGLRASVTCLDPRKLPAHLAGADFDEAFLDGLPDDADPCGENGEFHTFAWGGPMFASPLEIRRGETVERDGFIFTDFLPASGHIAERSDELAQM